MNEWVDGWGGGGGYPDEHVCGCEIAMNWTGSLCFRWSVWSV